MNVKSDVESSENSELLRIPVCRIFQRIRIADCLIPLIFRLSEFS